MALPSQYISVQCLWSNDNCCYDTGVVPSSGLKLKGKFYIGSQAVNYVFGARTSASNTSQGQTGFYKNGGSGGTGNSSVCYYNAQTSIADAGNYSAQIYIEKNGNVFSMNSQNAYLYELTGNTTAFTGSRSIYLGAMNNAGAILYGTGTHRTGIYGVYMKDTNGEYNFCPVYNTSTSSYGVYDTINNSFKSNLDSGTYPNYFLLEVQETEGGSAFIKTTNAGNVKKQYVLDTDELSGYESVFDTMWFKTTIRAIPSKGYEFVNWTLNDTEYSKEEEVTFNMTQNMVLKANFRKIVKENGYTGFKLYGLKYGSIKKPTSASDPIGRGTDIFANIRNFSIVEDGLSKSTSKIECEDIPSAFQTDTIVFIKSPKNKVVYCGVIKSIEDKVITCREPLSLFDTEFYFNRRSFKGDCALRSLWNVASYYADGNISWISNGAINDFTTRRMNTVEIDFNSDINFEYPCLFALPTTEVVISNMEDFIQDSFNDFGIYPKASLISYEDTDYGKGVYHYLQFLFDRNRDSVLNIGDNNESIRNVSVDIQDSEYTLLAIYNESGETLKGIFATETDGTISNITTYPSTENSRYIAYNNCKPKIVTSDDDVSTLVEQYLSNANYNHKIIFTVDLNGLYRFDDFSIGRRVNFYYKDKMYTSIVTGKSYSVGNNQNEIKEMKVTLGRVRNKLTTKINLGKVVNGHHHHH